MPTTPNDKPADEQAPAAEDDRKERAAKLKAEAAGKTVDGRPASKEKPTICVDCFSGVWPVGAHDANCEHGHWTRDADKADDEYWLDQADKQAAADAEAARQQVRQQA
jgi:hypothetical protein